MPQVWHLLWAQCAVRKVMCVTNEPKTRYATNSTCSILHSLLINLFGVNVHTLVAICLLAATANGPSVHTINLAEPPVTQPALVKIPKGPNSLTLYNEKGESVARARRRAMPFRTARWSRDSRSTM